MTAKKIIKDFKLEKHPEGGYYRRVWCSEVKSDFSKNNSTEILNNASHIYYLLEKNDFSAFHRINNEELWHHYSGSTIRIFILNSDGKLETQLLGKSIENGEQPTVVIPKNQWFAAEVVDKSDFGFVGCTVVPAFSFSGFELADTKKLIAEFPRNKELILRFQR